MTCFVVDFPDTSDFGVSGLFHKYIPVRGAKVVSGDRVYVRVNGSEIGYFNVLTVGLYESMVCPRTSVYLNRGRYAKVGRLIRV